MTGPGMVLSSPDTFGMNAAMMKMHPMQYPTLREATPVIWVNAAVPGWMMLGTAPAIPASRLEAPDPAIVPWTSRKLTARFSRRETRCSPIASPFDCMDMMMPRNRKAGSNVQNVTPKSRPSPGHSEGRPTQGARARFSMS